MQLIKVTNTISKYFNYLLSILRYNTWKRILCMTHPKKDRWEQLADDINKGYIKVENGSRLVINTDKIIEEGLAYFIDDTVDEVLNKILAKKEKTASNKDSKDIDIIKQVIKGRQENRQEDEKKRKDKGGSYKESFEKLAILFPSFRKAS